MELQKNQFKADMAAGKLQIGRFRIGDDHAKNEWLSVSEIFEYSSNIGTARMAFAVGGAPLLEGFFRRLGFYGPPAIEISEVVRPRTPKKWADEIAPWSMCPRQVDDLEMDVYLDFRGIQRPMSVVQNNPYFVTEIDDVPEWLADEIMPQLRPL